MELRHLRYFIGVAEAENVSRAALKLHVSQPALNRQIRDPEEELGFSLLKRSAKSVQKSLQVVRSELRSVIDWWPDINHWLSSPWPRVDYARRDNVAAGTLGASLDRL